MNTELLKYQVLSALQPSNYNETLRVMFTLFGAAVAWLEPTLPYISICTCLIIADCYTAWKLSRRVKRAYPNQASKEGLKFCSRKFGKVLATLLKSYFLIVVAYMIHVHITQGMQFNFTKVVAGAICFWQLWSILENESSCNGAKWAKVLQKIVVDKTERHFDIKLDGLEYEREVDNG